MLRTSSMIPVRTALATALFACSIVVSAAPQRFTIPVEKPGLTTAGIFNQQGKLVRVLWTMKQVEAPTKIPAVWNGLDQYGNPVSPGEYKWKLVTNRSTYNNIGVIGNTGTPPTTTGHVPIFIEGVAVDQNNGIYTVHDWDEPHYGIIRWSQKDGVSAFHTDNVVGEALLKGIAVEPDGQVAYVSGYQDLQDRSKAKFSIWRVRLHDGKGDPNQYESKVEDFTAAGRCIRVYDGAAEFPAGAAEAEKDLMGAPLLSLAVHGDTLYVTDSLKGRVLRYNKVTGESQGEFRAPMACGIVVAPDGSIWVGEEFSKVSLFSPSGERLATPISDLQEVRALAIRGNTLYVADRKAPEVRVYQISGTTLRKIGSFGKPARPGDRSYDRLQAIQGMAVDQSGNIIITDHVGLGGRIQMITPDFKPVWSQMCLEFSAQAAYNPAKPDIVYSSYKNVYRLDKKTGGWEFLGSGRTDKDHSYFGHYSSSHRGPPRALTLFGNEFFYFPAGDGVAVYRINESDEPQRGPVLNLVSAIAGCNPLPDGRHAEEGWRPENRYLWSWQDEEGDYQPEKEEIRILGSPGQPKDWEWPQSSITVDDRGWLWVSSYQRRLFPLEQPQFEHYSIYAIPPEGPNRQGNPIYRWESAVCVVDGRLGLQAMSIDENVERGWKLVGHSDDGMIYALGYSKRPGTAQEGGLHMGGNTLVAFRQPDSGKVEPLTAFAWTVLLPKSSVGLSPISGGSGGVLVGGDPWRGGIHHYTKDGLLIGSFCSDPRFGVQPVDWPSGMLDAHLAVSCQRDPRDGLLDVFAEDNMNHRLIWYRVDDRDVSTAEGKVTVP